MAKGSVRKKGKKWYYRFYVEDASGRLVQKEYAGTESKSETEKMLRHPISNRKLSTITSEHLQKFMDQLIYGGKEGDFNSHGGYCHDHANKYSAILNHAFHFAVFPKKYITFNPMQYVVMHKRKNDAEIFTSED